MSVSSPGMATQNSPRAQPRSFDRAIFVDRITRVLRARRRVATRTRQQRRDRLLIKTDCTGQRPGDQRFSSHEINSSRSSVNEASYASRRALIITSIGGSRLRNAGKTSFRNTSRSRLFTLLRSTALRRCLGTTAPTRGYGKREAESKTSRWSVLLLFPFVISARISRLLVMRRERGRRCFTSTTTWNRPSR